MNHLSDQSRLYITKFIPLQWNNSLDLKDLDGSKDRWEVIDRKTNSEIQNK